MERGGLAWLSVMQCKYAGGASVQGCETWILSAEVMYMVVCVEACQ